MGHRGNGGKGDGGLRRLPLLQRLRARKATVQELQTIHSENHVRLYGRSTQRRPGQEKKEMGRAFVQLSCGGSGVDRDTYWNEAHTSNASRMVSSEEWFGLRGAHN